jgi:general secretion pathway protein A
MLTAMYAPFFGLQQAPFSIAPDPRYLFMSERHREALAHLLYGLGGGGGFVLLTGEIGAGKTTVCRCWLEQIPPGCRVAYLFNPRLSATELLRSVCDEFHIDGISPTPPTIKDYVDRLNAFLLATHAAGGSCLLIIDEAQQLAPEVLEQLRLLTNLETNERKLLQIVLIGQPELRQMLARPELEQLAQRVIARYHLEALSAPETEQYIRHRLAVAGLAGPLPFDGAALRRIHRLARGVPRRINLLADRALLGAYAGGQAVVGRAIVDGAAAEVFDAGPSGGAGALARGWRRAAARPGLAMAASALVGAALTVALVAPMAPRRMPPTNEPAMATRTTPSLGPPGGRPAGETPQPSAKGSRPALAAPDRPAIDMAGSSQSPPAARVADPPTAAIAAQDPQAAAPSPTAWATGGLPGPTGAPKPAAGGGAVTGFASEDAAWRTLAADWQLVLEPGREACEAAARQQVHCWRARTTLAVIRQLDRPGVLTLQNGEGSPAFAILTGLGRDSATLRLGGAVRTLPLAELARRWRGDFATLWRAPTGWEGRAVDERAGPLPDWLAHRLDAASVAPASPRVAAFQIAQGLQPDGLAGPTTFMQLNRATGPTEPRLTSPDGPAGGRRSTPGAN